jgi:hypothetical protein
MMQDDPTATMRDIAVRLAMAPYDEYDELEAVAKKERAAEKRLRRYLARHSAKSQ